MTPSTQSEGPFAPHLSPGERLRWQVEPGPAALAPEEHRSILRWALFTGAIGTVLASLADVPATYLPGVFVTLAVVATLWGRRSSQLSPTRAYAITSERLLILDQGKLRAFTVNDVPYVKVVTMADETVDIFWGEDKQSVSAPSNNQSNSARASMTFTGFSRSSRRGFLALPSAEPAAGLITAWRDGAVAAAAKAVPMPAQVRGREETGTAPEGSAAALRPSDTDAWRTLREPTTGFSMTIPKDWKAKAAQVRKIWIFEPEPSWGSPDGAGWNRLEAYPDVQHVGIKVSINPPTMPASLAEVLNDKWARVLNLKTLDQMPDVRVGALTGFSVVRDLKGVGLQASFGAVRVGTERSEIAATSQQWWLRGDGHAVEVQVVWPSGADAMREVLERAVASIRLREDTPSAPLPGGR